MEKKMTSFLCSRSLLSQSVLRPGSGGGLIAFFFACQDSLGFGGLFLSLGHSVISVSQDVEPPLSQLFLSLERTASLLFKFYPPLPTCLGRLPSFLLPSTS